MDGLCGLAVTDLDYPQRSAHTLAARELSTYDKLNPTWSSLINNDQLAEPAWLVADLKAWQDPVSQDKLLKIQREIGKSLISTCTPLDLTA
jgi:hypothetical protein